MDDMPLYLTSAEIALFRRHVSGSRAAWEPRIAEETAPMSDTPEAMQSRLGSTTFDAFPDVRAMADDARSALLSGKKLADLPGALPEDAVPEFLSALGPLGISACIEIALREEKLSEEDFLAIEHLARVRHAMLKQGK